MSPINENSTAKRFWRSLGELAQSPDALARLHGEFPDAGELELSGISRRQFTKLMAASLALAGVTSVGCRRWPEQQIRPQTARTEGFYPGVAEYYATQFELDGVATGILAKSIDGRPIKIEGNLLHPFSLGAADIHAQASVLELYDPQRSRSYVYRPNSERNPSTSESGNPSTGANSNQGTGVDRQVFEQSLAPHFASLKQRSGAGLHFLSQPVSSPTFGMLQTQIQLDFPKSSWHIYCPVDRDNEREAAKIAFGQAVRCQYHLDQASTIVCFEADILGNHPAHQRLARDWAIGRQPDAVSYNRLIAIESAYSVTGAAADVRYPLRPSEIVAVIQYVAVRLGLPGSLPEVDAQVKQWADPLLEALASAGPAALIIAGPSLSPEAIALVHSINHRLGSFGKTVSFTDEPLAQSQSSVDSLSALCKSLRAGTVDTLVILHGNPVYDAPADLKLELSASQTQKPLVSLHLGLYDNETSRQCTWHVPAAHFLESWSDGRAWDGTYSIQQPLIRPLFNGMSSIELLSLIVGQAVPDGHDLVRGTAKTQFGVADENSWQSLLHDGVLPDSAFEIIELRPPLVINAIEADDSPAIEVRFAADHKIHDGRFGNNGWLQELPDPLTKLTWGNAALISMADADRLSLTDGEEIDIEFDGETTLAGIPVVIQPGHAAGCITLPLGYGQTLGLIAENVGTDVYRVRTSRQRFVAKAAEIRKNGRRQQLAVTQEHHLIDPVGMAAREFRVGKRAAPGLLVRETTLPQHRDDPQAVHQPFHIPPPAPMFDQPNPFNAPHAWGMAIDLNRCIGCNACVIACQAENNIPIVGKANVIQNREMHWIRIDRYFKGEPESPDVVHVPVACAQCEDAPCEQVCPVAATVHDSEGLNAMIYNRCVGTRYCANNCPYKVRRFNYFDYHASNPKAPPKPWLHFPDRQTLADTSKVQQLMFNPDVSVRMRGVMEKCTYCVQRISQAKLAARLDHARQQRPRAVVGDGEVLTACQQSCPTQAITFGDLNDKNSQVSIAQNDARAYSMLAELNIKPRTRYLARIRNVEAMSAENEHHG